MSPIVDARVYIYTVYATIVLQCVDIYDPKLDFENQYRRCIVLYGAEK